MRSGVMGWTGAFRRNRNANRPNTFRKGCPRRGRGESPEEAASERNGTLWLEANANHPLPGFCANANLGRWRRQGKRDRGFGDLRACWWVGGWFCRLSDWRAALAPGRRRPRLPRPTITGARVINGIRAGAPPTTGTGITATTGKVRRPKVVRRAGAPGGPHRLGRRRSHLPRRGRRGPS
jgi:hypothetical protein